MPATLQNLAAIIKSKAKNKAHFVIAISGFGGSGKSTVAKKLNSALKKSTIISLDSFIIDRLSKRSKAWSGFDWTRLIEQVLKPIKSDKDTIRYDVYDWAENKNRPGQPLQVPKYIIVEGVGLIRNSLKNYFDFSIWIDVPLKTASEQGKKRDREEQQIDHDKLWDELWTPNDKDYYKKYQPKSNVDFILETNFQK